MHIHCNSPRMGPLLLNMHTPIDAHSVSITHSKKNAALANRNHECQSVHTLLYSVWPCCENITTFVNCVSIYYVSTVLNAQQPLCQTAFTLCPIDITCTMYMNIHVYTHVQCTCIYKHFGSKYGKII